MGSCWNVLFIIRSRCLCCGCSFYYGGVKVSDQENKDKFLKLADLAFTWLVIDKDGTVNCFKSKKEAVDFMMKSQQKKKGGV